MAKSQTWLSDFTFTAMCRMVVHLFLVNSLNEKNYSKETDKFFFCQNHICHVVRDIWGFPGGGGGKELSANAGDVRHVGSVSGLGRSLGRGHSNSLQDSGLENPMDRGAWWATVHGVTESRNDWMTQPTVTQGKLNKQELRWKELIFHR